MDDRSEVSIQRDYYTSTALDYNNAHLNGDPEHLFALDLLIGMLDHLNVKSVLDIGSGTGRVVLALKQRRPDIVVKGIEPVAALRQIGYAAGLSSNDLFDGNAMSLTFVDGEFDLVCAFGVLHHVRRPGRAVAEMLRVARKAVFLSDSNNFGQGSCVSRTAKQVLSACGLWRLANLMATRGRGYTFSAGDGLGYSYSVFNNHRQFRRVCRTVHMMNTTGSAANMYRGASHVALFGVKADES